ncbi:unnamed protein product [Prunus armeniaca]
MTIPPLCQLRLFLFSLRFDDMAQNKKVKNFLHRLDQFQFGRQFQALGPVNQTVLSPNQPPKPMPCIEIWKVLSIDKRRWEDLQIDYLVKVLVKVGMESLLLDVPFVCKSWYKATLNPSCLQSLIFPDNECIEVWSWDVSECPNFQNLMDRFASEYQIDGDRCSVTAFLKFVINRSSGNATVLKLPKCCTVEAFEFAANVCPGLVTLSLPEDVLDSKHTNLELMGK